MEKSKNSNLIQIFGLAVLFTIALPLTWAQNSDKKTTQHLRFEGSLIEGQMGTINALIVTSEKRPEFKPMALQLGQATNEFQNLEDYSVNKDKHDKPFPVELE